MCSIRVPVMAVLGIVLVAFCCGTVDGAPKRKISTTVIPKDYHHPLQTSTINVEHKKNGVFSHGKVNGEHIEFSKSVGSGELHFSHPQGTFGGIGPHIVHVQAHQFTPVHHLTPGKTGAPPHVIPAHPEQFGKL